MSQEPKANGTTPSPPPGPPVWQVAAAAFLLPGSGQLWSGKPVAAITTWGLLTVLVVAVRHDRTLIAFLIALWLYQLIDAGLAAAHRRASAEAAANDPAGSLVVTSSLALWTLLAVALLALAENVAGLTSRFLPVLVPSVLVAAGVRLVWTYFRPADEPGDRA